MYHLALRFISEKLEQLFTLTSSCSEIGSDNRSDVEIIDLLRSLSLEVVSLEGDGSVCCVPTNILKLWIQARC